MSLSKSELQHAKFCAELCHLVYDPDLKANPKRVHDIVSDVNVESDFKYFDVVATDTQALILVKDDLIYVSFQGTQSLLDWLNNAWLDLKGINDVGHHHSGFMDVSEKSFLIVGKHLLSLLEHRPNSKVVLTGHSLGGAMATMYAFILKQKHSGVNIHSVITFGQPRCGDKPFSEYLNSLNLNYKRFVNDGDYIADVPSPSKWGNWSHAGLGFLLAESEMSLENANYEASLPKRIWTTVVAVFQLLRVKNFKIKELNKEELKKISSNHDMPLYIKRIEEEINRL